MRHTLIFTLWLAGATAASAQESPDSEEPQVAFNNHCRQCHSTDEGDNRLGPNLHQIVGREAAAAEGYAYSDSLSGSDITWDKEQLDAWIEDPDSVVTGHKMKPYPGISEPEIRSAIITHLKG